MIKVTLKDGSIREFNDNTDVISIAKDISEGLARNVISAKFNTRIVETQSSLNSDGNIEFFTWDDDEGKKAFWHYSSHVMAQALQEMYPGIKLTIGPAIKNGFYYDVDLGEHKISESDFDKIENKMLEICRGKFDFNMRLVSKDEALDFYENKKNNYESYNATKRKTYNHRIGVNQYRENTQLRYRHVISMILTQKCRNATNPNAK